MTHLIVELKHLFLLDLQIHGLKNILLHSLLVKEVKCKNYVLYEENPGIKQENEFLKHTKISSTDQGIDFALQFFIVEVKSSTVYQE
ncbi:hypothetical protein ER45_029035 (plasmid) [Bacillus mycoides]|nr:hypothetical protein ER45_029035 [Bacillus mycoides]